MVSPGKIVKQQQPHPQKQTVPNGSSPFSLLSRSNYCGRCRWLWRKKKLSTHLNVNKFWKVFTGYTATHHGLFWTLINSGGLFWALNFLWTILNPSNWVCWTHCLHRGLFWTLIICGLFWTLNISWTILNPSFEYTTTHRGLFWTLINSDGLFWALTFSWTILNPSYWVCWTQCLHCGLFWTLIICGGLFWILNISWTILNPSFEPSLKFHKLGV